MKYFGSMNKILCRECSIDFSAHVYVKMYKTGLYFITAGSKCSVIDFVVHPETYALGEKVCCTRGGC